MTSGAGVLRLCNGFSISSAPPQHSFSQPTATPPSPDKMSTVTQPPLTLTSWNPSPATGLMTFFLPDSAPSSLVASVVQVTYVTTVTNPKYPSDGEWVTSLVLDCPPGTKPGKDACRAANIYPASVYHTRGSVWGGATTAQADDSTTTWRCELAQRWNPSIDGTSKPGMSAYCTKTIEAPGKPRETTTTNYDECYVYGHQLPIVVTAGGEKVGPSGDTFFSGGEDADTINSYRAKNAAEVPGCTPTASEVFWAPPTMGPGMMGSATKSGGGGGAAGPTPTDGGLGEGGGPSKPGVTGGSGSSAPTSTSVPSAGRRTVPSLVKGAMAGLVLLAVLSV
ncbi:hypothetical protein QBC39DRAFT_340792 [Podospora conica]|nr:hypothetical protein QBC39DRAFT_340792 [Schizothecium conicum]